MGNTCQSAVIPLSRSFTQLSPGSREKYFPLQSNGPICHSSLVVQGEIVDTRLEFLRGTLDVLILKALVWGPLHGYAITSLIRRHSDNALLLEEGTLYPALWRLEEKQWL